YTLTYSVRTINDWDTKSGGLGFGGGGTLHIPDTAVGVSKLWMDTTRAVAMAKSTLVASEGFGMRVQAYDDTTNLPAPADNVWSIYCLLTLMPGTPTSVVGIPV